MIKNLLNFISRKFDIIFLYFLFFISFFLLLYVIYKSELIHSGANRNFYFTYFIVSIFSFLFCLILYFLSTCNRIKILKIFTIFVIALYIFEFYLYNSKYFDKISLKNQFIESQVREKEINSSGNFYDHRSFDLIFNDFKRSYPEIVFNNHIKHNNNNIFPLSGVSKTKTMFLCNENGYVPIYQSDRYGFNNEDFLWDKKEVDYLLLGDSFVHGKCVTNNYNIQNILEKLSGKVVLNLGYTGNGPLTEYATLSEYINLVKPKKILWFFYEGNDLLNLQLERQNEILKKYLAIENYSQNLIYKQSDIDLIQRIDNFEIIIKNHDNNSKQNSYNFFSFFKLENIRRLTIQRILYIPPPLYTEFNDVAFLMKKISQENNSQLYFIYLPEYERYKSKLTNSNFQNYNKVLDIIKNNNINLIDIKFLFEQEKDPLIYFPFRSYGHYNHEGYFKVSKHILNKIN